MITMYKDFEKISTFQECSSDLYLPQKNLCRLQGISF